MNINFLKNKDDLLSTLYAKYNSVYNLHGTKVLEEDYDHIEYPVLAVSSYIDSSYSDWTDTVLLYKKDVNEIYKNNGMDI